jgi:two-component system, cell cycle response regulator
VLLLGDAASRPSGLERSLARLGYLLVEAEGGELVSPPPAPPDLVVVSTPDADDRLAEALTMLSGDAWRTIPRVVILGGSSPDGVSRALSLGADDAVGAGAPLTEITARITARLRHANGSGVGRETLWRQELMFDILEELSATLRSDAIVETLVRRVGLALELPKCSFLLAAPGDRYARVVAVCERPAARDLRVDLQRYPEIREALRTGRTVFIPDLERHPFFAEIEPVWRDLGVSADVRSVAVIPVGLHGRQAGAFLLRTRHEDPVLTPEQLQFAERLLRATTRLLENEEKRAGAARHLTSAAATDLLTGCGNLDALNRRLGDEFERARRYSLTFSLVLLDVDGLREYNRRFGTIGGDRVMAGLGGLLLEAVRSPDFVSRYGGDEFGLLLPETDLAGARSSVHRVRRLLEARPFPELPAGERPQLSAGIVSFPHPAVHGSEDLFALVEAALLRGKGQREGRIGTAEAVAG